MNTRALCIHAHFYQPPRENPITGVIPNEAGAAPYHNWNERIHAECYRPNAELGNFTRVSFNLGPTLLRWMNGYDPATVTKIVAQDKANLARHGVGNAIAQAYNHTILPLASRLDKTTQVRWGIADFEHHFGRKPQGMWLPETAADLETLAVLAENGIEFTILAPWQANTDSLDTSEPYRVALPEGRSLAVFFYNAELSAHLSFNPDATSNADTFLQREIAPRFKPRQGEPQLVMIASDGELYGHHQKFRDRFLAHLVNGALSHYDIQMTYPALWLKSNPPHRTMSIREKTSWSCHHGVLRWMGECTCTPGDGRWKYYLRHALDVLANALDRLYYDYAMKCIADPWELRHRYIHVMLGQIPASELIFELAGRRLADEDVRCLHLLLEAQRERQRMYTSCGWFFEDFARIEPRNNLAYAAQAVRLARQATGENLAPHVVDLLRFVASPSGMRGDRVFLKQLRQTEALPVVPTIK